MATDKQACGALCVVWCGQIFFPMKIFFPPTFPMMLESNSTHVRLEGTTFMGRSKERPEKSTSHWKKVSQMIVCHYCSGKLDLLTPNRLRLGRNNERSPKGQMVTLAHPDKILQANESAFNSWFEVWLLCHVPKIFSQEKWFESDRQPRKGDIVLFLKQESGISNTDYTMESLKKWNTARMAL